MFERDRSAQSNEDNILHTFIRFFLALLQHLREWCKSFDLKGDAKLKEMRKKLWYTLAKSEMAFDQKDRSKMDGNFKASELFWHEVHFKISEPENLKPPEDLIREIVRNTALMD